LVNLSPLICSWFPLFELLKPYDNFLARTFNLIYLSPLIYPVHLFAYNQPIYLRYVCTIYSHEVIWHLIWIRLESWLAKKPSARMG